MLKHLVAATTALALALLSGGGGAGPPARAQRPDDGPAAAGAPEHRDGLRQQPTGAAAAASPASPQRQGGGVARFVAHQGAEQIRYREIHRAAVVDRRGEEVGRVEGAILDDAGRLVGALVAVGGFLGVARRTVVVPWRALRTARGGRPGEPVTLTLLDLTGEQLREAPEYQTPQRAQADRVVEDSRRRMLEKQERGVLQRVLQALDRADQALQVEDQEAARAALTRARQAVEQAIEAQQPDERQQQ